MVETEDVTERPQKEFMFLRATSKGRACQEKCFSIWSFGVSVVKPVAEQNLTPCPFAGFLRKNECNQRKHGSIVLKMSVARGLVYI